MSTGSFGACAQWAVLVAMTSLVAASGTASAQSTPAPAATAKEATVAGPKQLLFVGNSYLYYGDSLHNHVRRMAIAAGIATAKQLKYKSVTISGGALHQHPIEAYLAKDRLGVKGGFNVVVLQGGSAAPLSQPRRKLFAETVQAFDRQIKAQGGRTALYMTHAYVKPHKKTRPGMINDIASLYMETAKAVGAQVIPVGLAFEEAYRQRPQFNLHQSFDGSHPNIFGTYLAACVVYAVLYNRSPLGNPYDYFGKIDAGSAKFLQTVADQTVRTFNAR